MHRCMPIIISACSVRYTQVACIPGFHLVRYTQVACIPRFYLVRYTQVACILGQVHTGSMHTWSGTHK